MFSKTGATVRNKYHVQLQKIICCNEKPEAATIGILLKKTATLLEEGSSIAKFIRAPILKIICERLLVKISISVTNFPKGGNF